MSGHERAATPEEAATVLEGFGGKTLPESVGEPVEEVEPPVDVAPLVSTFDGVDSECDRQEPGCVVE